MSSVGHETGEHNQVRKARTQDARHQGTRRMSNPTGMAALVLHLQRTVGNRAVGHWLHQYGSQVAAPLRQDGSTGGTSGSLRPAGVPPNRVAVQRATQIEVATRAEPRRADLAAARGEDLSRHDQIAIQRMLEEPGTDCQGPKGKKTIYKDSEDGKFYFKSGTSTATVWQMIEVTLGDDQRYAVPDADRKRAYNVATKAWLKPGEAAPAEPPKARTGWSLSEVRGAGFAPKAANHYQKDYPDFKGYHVHASAYKERDGAFTSFHVKFDTGGEHLSYFYNFNGSTHPGQNMQDQLRIIQKFIRPFKKVTAVSTIGPLTRAQQSDLEREAREERQELVVEADAIAGAVGLSPQG